ncbi:hypothetical protein FHG87_019570 [Trinorchestia longiramus]|nr:hypothetical protein FHG87_019570 [Trinorchestia longiramus]
MCGVICVCELHKPYRYLLSPPTGTCCHLLQVLVVTSYRYLLSPPTGTCCHLLQVLVVTSYRYLSPFPKSCRNLEPAARKHSFSWHCEHIQKSSGQVLY